MECNVKITNQLQEILNCRQSIEVWLISYSSEIGRQYLKGFLDKFENKPTLRLQF